LARRASSGGTPRKRRGSGDARRGRAGRDTGNSLVKELRAAVGRAERNADVMRGCD